MKTFILLFWLTVPSVAQEFLIGESLCVGLIAVDWRQTRYIAKRDWITNDPKKGWVMHHETNPILGKRPGVRKVDIYMGAAIVGHAILAKKLPRHWRYALWGATIALQARVIYRNHKNGLKVL